MPEASDDVELPLRGTTVTRCLIDAAFGLEFYVDRESSSTVRIEGSFSLHEGGEQLQFSPENTMGLGRALILLGKKVQSAVAKKGGSLELRFEGGHVIVVPPDPHYEAWTFAGPRGMLVVSTPSGGLAIWSDASP
jgi:hypothetical protein